MTEKNDFQSMMSNFMQNAGKMQDVVKAYQEMVGKSGDKQVQGKAGGDMVIAHVNLKMQVVHLELSDAVLEEKKEVLSELIAGAVNQGLTLAQQQMRMEMAEIAKKLGLPPQFGNLG